MPEFILAVAASLTAGLIERKLFKGNKKRFAKKLAGIIDKTIVEYSKKHPVEYNGKEIPFYGSQAIINELLKFSFFEELDQDKISEALRENPNIIELSIDELNNFLRIFNEKIKACEELKGFEKKETFIDKNFENYLKLDEILKLLKKERTGKDKPIPKHLTKIPPYNTDDLIGREELIKRITEELESKSNVTLVNGIGGIGKTTIALAYVNTPALMEHYDHIDWITVFDNIINDTITQLTGSVPGFTYNKGETPEDNFYRLLNKLGEIKGNNLLVIDNANNLQNLLNVKRGIEALRWKVIITSRTEPQGYNNIPVDTLEKEDAKALFYRYYKKEQNDEFIENLLKKIEYHTLLTELLAKAANENPGLDLQKLCDILDNKDLAAEELQTDIVTDHELDEKSRLKMVQLYSYINKIFEATANNLNEEEKKYLLYFAVMPSQFLDFARLIDYFQINSKDKTTFASTLNKLYRKGWLIKEKGRDYKAHSFIQTITREKLQPDTKNCAVLINTFATKLFTEPGDNPLSRKEYVPFAESLLEAVKDEDKETATLANNLATILKYLGIYEKALEYNLKALTIREKVLEPNHPSLATSYNNIAITYSDLGNYEKALEYNLKDMAICEKVLEPNHPSLATSYNNIAETYSHLGQYEKALEYHQKAITIREKVLEPNHPDLATSYNNIAITYRKLGNYEKALEYHLKANDIIIKVLEPNHPSLATSYSNIAETYRHLGQYEKALEYHLKAIVICEKVLELKHPLLATSYSNIAITYSDLGNYEKALEYYQKTISIRENILDPNHPDIAQFYNNIALTYSDLSNYEKALEYLQKALTICEKVLEPNHPDLATSYMSIATVYYYLKNYKKAKYFIDKAIKIYKKALPAGHPYIKNALEWREEINREL